MFRESGISIPEDGHIIKFGVKKFCDSKNSVKLDISFSSTTGNG